MRLGNGWCVGERPGAVCGVRGVAKAAGPAAISAAGRATGSR